MASQVKPTHIPLWCWFVVLVCVIGLTILSHPFVAYITNTNETLAEVFNLKRLQHHKPGEAVVALGSSLSLSAYAFDGAMAKNFKRAGINNRFIRIASPGANRETFEPLLTRIVQLRPRFVFVELEMLQIKRNENKGFLSYEFLFENLYESIKWLKNSFFKMGYPAEGNYGHWSICVNDISVKAKNMQLIELPQRNFALYQQRFTAQWLNFFANIKHHGGQIILVEIGRSDYAAKGLTKTFSRDFSRRKTEISAIDKIEIWQYPGPFSDLNYCDLAHFNSTGTALFNLWFTDKFASLKGLGND